MVDLGWASFLPHLDLTCLSSPISLPPGLKENLTDETEARLVTARKELAWSSERGHLALEKLEDHFVSSSAVEHIQLNSFDSNMAVSSFRTIKLTGWQKESMEHVRSLIAHEQASRLRSRQKSALDRSEDDDEAENDGEDMGRDTNLVREEKVSKAQERSTRYVIPFVLQA